MSTAEIAINTTLTIGVEAVTWRGERNVVIGGSQGDKGP